MGLSLSYQNFSWLALLLLLALGFASSFSDGTKEKHNQLLGRSAIPRHILSNGLPIPPSGPSKGNPPLDPFPSSFGELSKGSPVQPSDAGATEHRVGVSHPFPKISLGEFHVVMKPKGAIIPPSAPGKRHNAAPPET
ncbi:cuticle collagen 1-like [Pyrus ussuriensis x Pyrus communis]|uniref:Cuticle collagen 1-like n=1 Tax=Pyrus ussuriensis x Pyrus communis TaxID=2448454 RepID=A0A5N5H3Q3_9ROSA|nr:cuticle collagen 1-like [Pyrus ussuriensis x Pyrus communis]